MNDPFQTVHLFDDGKYQRTVRLYRHSISTNSPFSVIPTATFLIFLSLDISIYFYYTNYRFFEPKALPIGVRLVLIPEDCDL